MDIAITAIHIIACLFLIGVVLLQQGKGADMGAVFGGSSQTVFGSSGAGNFLTRLTTVTAIIFMLTSLTLAYGSARDVTSTVFDDAPVALPAGNPAPQAGVRMDDGVGAAAEALGDAAADAAAGVEGGVGAAVDAAGQAANDAANAAAKAADAAKQAIDEAADQAADALNDAADQGAAVIEENVDAAVAGAQEIAEDSRAAADQAAADVVDALAPADQGDPEPALGTD